MREVGETIPDPTSEVGVLNSTHFLFNLYRG
jgi:hypothetical protein